LLTSDGSPEILLAAASDKQAGRLFDGVAAYIRRSPELAALCRVRDHVGEIVREDGGGKIYRLSSDPKRLHGYNPSLVVCDELAQWTDPTLKRAYAALTSGGGARKAPQVFTITTAGEARDREDSILGRILDQAQAKGEIDAQPGLTVARLWPARLLVFNHEAPTSDPHDVKAMKLANPASWITLDYLREQAEDPELSDAEVLQLHGCVWAAGQTHWLPAGAWRECEAPFPDVPKDDTEVVLGFDGSYNNDSTALVGCTLDGHVFVVGVWEKPDTRGEWVVPRGEVESVVAAAMQRWRVVELACDPPGWHREIEEWQDRWGIPPVVPFDTNRRATMVTACSRFFTAVVNRQLTHDGNERLAAHLSHAVIKETPNGAYITKEHGASPRKIDLAVAAVVAYDKAMQADSGAGYASLSDEDFERVLAG
jgi:phage terminase large subunit-like protein